MTRIIVVGAGVIGLTTALVLRDNLPTDKVSIEVISDVLPGDVAGPDGQGDAVMYASPRAGAHWSASEEMPEPRIGRWEIVSYKMFRKLAKVPDSWVKREKLYCGVIPDKHGKYPKYVEPWFSKSVDGYTYLSSDDTKFPRVRNLYKFDSFVISTTFYLFYLMNKLTERRVRVHRGKVDSLEKLTKSYDIVVNCTGYGARDLVKDKRTEELERITAVRGHTLLVANSLPYQVIFEEEEPEEPGEFLMLFPRAEGGAVLGGIYDSHSEFKDTSIHKDYVDRLFAKAAKYLPELKPKQIKVINHSVGFRPMRAGGARVEHDTINPKIIHNYGCGNVGYIQSWGCAQDILSMVRKDSKL